MPKQIRTAHVFEEKWRSKDVRIQEEADFSSLGLSERVFAGLKKCGFKVPSPIQIESIPVGRYGKDLILQAKSGTGKTLVFTVIALEALLNVEYPQVLILAPTREIATQICDVIKSVGCEFKNLKCHSFIGGIPTSKDLEKIVGCQIAVGTPGRIKQLIEKGNLPIHSIRMLILDEADVLLDSSFKSDIDFIFMALPKEKQVIATSATYPNELQEFIRTYFRDAFLVRLNVNKLALLGIVHYVQQVEASQMPHLAYQQKLKVLSKVLTSIKFTQCLVFCNLKSRVEPLCYDIRGWGFSTAFISSAKEQCDRLKAIDCLKRFRCSILVSSDVISRGIDVENVDLIINFDKPQRLEIYMHRCGRAGRFGTKGVVITFLSADEIDAFEKMEREGNFQAYTLPDPVPSNLIKIRPKGLDVSDDESSENEDSNTDFIVNSVLENGRIEKKNNSHDRSPLSKQKMHDSIENFSDEKHLLINGANGCISNHVLDLESGKNKEYTKEENDLYICVKSKKVSLHESDPKALNETDCKNFSDENNLNVLKETNQKLQTDSYEDIKLKVNEDIEQGATFASSSDGYCDGKEDSGINHTAAESNLETSISETINNLVSKTPEAETLSDNCVSPNSLQIQMNDLELNQSKVLALNKIQTTIVQFLIDHNKNQNKNNCSEDISAKNSSKVKSTSKGFLSTTKIVNSNQIKEVRENLNNFYQKIYQSYQSKHINEETCNEIKLKSLNEEKTDVFIDDKNVQYKKIVLQYKPELDDVPSDSESTSSTLSSTSAFKILDEYMFQGSGKTKNKVDSDNSSTSSSSSDSSDSADTGEYFELYLGKRNTPTTELPSRKQTSNKKTQMSEEKQNGLSEKLQLSNKTNLASNTSPYNTEYESQLGARRKTSNKNYQTCTSNMRKPIQTSESEDCSYSKKFTKRLTPNNRVPKVKKTKVKSKSDTVKDHDNLPYFNSYNSHPFYYPHYPGYQAVQNYVSQNPVTTLNTHCSTHRCHMAGSSFCFNDACIDWYGMFYRQWMYIQMCLANGH